jgi:hypothetical protein
MNPNSKVIPDMVTLVCGWYWEDSNTSFALYNGNVPDLDYQRDEIDCTRRNH